MLGGYPIGGDQLQLPDYAGQAQQAVGMGAMPQGSNPLPNYAGQAQSAVAQGMFAAPPPKPSFFGQGGVGRGIAGSIGDYLLQRAGAQPIYSPAMQAQAEAHRQMMMKQMEAMQPQHIGDSLVQQGPDGQYHTLWSKPDAPDDPKPTEQQRNYEWLKTIDPPGAEEYRKNLTDPIHWIQVDDPATGGKSMVPVNHNGPLSTQAQGAVSQPSPVHIAALIAHPELAHDFDAKFGPGASARYLHQGGPGPSDPATFP